MAKQVITRFCNICKKDTKNKITRHYGDKESHWDLTCKICGNNISMLPYTINELIALEENPYLYSGMAHR